MNTRLNAGVDAKPPTPLSTPTAAALQAGGLALPTPILGLTAQDICHLALDDIAALQRFVAQAKCDLAALSQLLQTGLELRYAAAVKAQLLAEGKDTGTTHLQENGFDIAVEIGKDVKWEPKGLAALVGQIQASGGDPSEYVELKYSVSEAKFKSWPQSLRAPFEALRTVTPKAPKFVLRRLDANLEGQR